MEQQKSHYSRPATLPPPPPPLPVQAESNSTANRLTQLCNSRNVENKEKLKGGIKNKRDLFYKFRSSIGTVYLLQLVCQVVLF